MARPGKGIPRPAAGFSFLSAALLLLAAWGCGPAGGEAAAGAPAQRERPATERPARLHLAGSDTLLHLAAVWAEAYHATHPGVTVTVVGGGSGVGIQGLLLGVDDIALSSRPAGAAEQAEARRRGFALVGTPVARDAVVVVVHPSNPVVSLSRGQLRRIFSGEVQNWREVGGPDLPLLAFSRGFSSGTGQIFREVVFGPGEAGGDGVVQVPGSALLHDEVARQRGAVGYLGLAYLTPRVRPVAVAARDGGPAVAPTPANLLTGRYPLTRPLWFYTRGEPQGAAADFIRFVLSPQGQRIATEHGYLPR